MNVWLNIWIGVLIGNSSTDQHFNVKKTAEVLICAVKMQNDYHFMFLLNANYSRVFYLNSSDASVMAEQYVHPFEGVHAPDGQRRVLRSGDQDLVVEVNCGNHVIVVLSSSNGSFRQA